jgi:hypothetical protein
MSAQMSPPERYFRYSQWALATVFVLILTYGILFLVNSFRPNDPTVRLITGYHWIYGLAGAILLGVLLFLQVAVARGAEMKGTRRRGLAVEADEWQQKNLDRAMRVAFVVMVFAQFPLAWLLSSSSATMPLLAMGVTTVHLGIATLLGTYLYLSREPSGGE